MGELVADDFLHFQGPFSNKTSRFDLPGCTLMMMKAIHPFF